MDFRRKQRIKRVLFSRITILLLVVVVGVLGRGVWGIYHKERDTRDKLEQTIQERQELDRRHTFLENDIGRLKDPGGVEEEIRETFGLGKEGEGVIIVVSDENTAAASTAEESGVWHRIKQMFKRD